MTIKELSNLSHVNTETIRAYRKKGFLHPTQNPKNNYYNYSQEDFLNLLYIRKLRSINLSLESIAMTFHEKNIDATVAEYRRQLAHLQEELRMMQAQETGLKVALDHLDAYRETFGGIHEIESFDDKVDSYFADSEGDPDFDIWLQHVGMFSQTIGIPKEMLLSKDLPEQIPVKVGLGTYRSFLTENSFPTPKHSTFCPKGTYVTAHLEMTGLDFVDRSQLEPMLQYIRDKGYSIGSDATAFLFRIDYTEQVPKYLYRLRVKVK